MLRAKEGEPVGLTAEYHEETFQAVKKHLESKGFDPRILDYLREWGVLEFGSDESFYFKKYARRSEKARRVMEEWYPFLEVDYFGAKVPTLHLQYARWGGSPHFEVKAIPVGSINLELEDPQDPKIVFEAPWREGKIKISQDGSVFLEGRISPPPREKLMSNLDQDIPLSSEEGLG